MSNEISRGGVQGDTGTGERAGYGGFFPLLGVVGGNTGVLGLNPVEAVVSFTNLSTISLESCLCGQAGIDLLTTIGARLCRGGSNLFAWGGVTVTAVTDGGSMHSHRLAE